MGLFEDIYNVVKSIPSGKVMSYGAVARLAGRPRAARQVGWALHGNPDQSGIPCHRVVTKDGRVSPAFVFGGANIQIDMLRAEGVEFLPDGNVDMARFGI